MGEQVTDPVELSPALAVHYAAWLRRYAAKLFAEDVVQKECLGNAAALLEQFDRQRRAGGDRYNAGYLDGVRETAKAHHDARWQICLWNFRFELRRLFARLR